MEISFRPYTVSDRAVCLSLFDQNCPEYFSPNERAEYEEFLVQNLPGYEICSCDGVPAGVFGLFEESKTGATLNWIMIDPGMHGCGIGSAMMSRVLLLANAQYFETILIATSHKACEFFLRHGASIVSRIENGWGPNMHRIDMKLDLVGHE